MVLSFWTGHARSMSRCCWRWASNTRVLRAAPKAGVLPPILGGLVRSSARRVKDAKGSLARRLAGVPESDWDKIVLDLVKGHVASVLGHASGDAVDPQRAFKDLGFDSLSAVELRNRLVQGTGVKLPTTLVFDHPTPAAVAGVLALAGEEGVERRAPRRTLARAEGPLRDRRHELPLPRRGLFPRGVVGAGRFG